MRRCLLLLLLLLFIFAATSVPSFFWSCSMTQGEEDIDHVSFHPEHRSMLALVAHTAVQSVRSRGGECLLDALFAAEPALLEYPELCVLLELHKIRRALRNTQEAPAHAQSSFYTVVRDSLGRLHSVLPDPLLAALGGALEQLRDRPEVSRALGPHMLDLVEYIQVELLRETKLLQRRGESISLRLRTVPPFVAT